MAAHLLPQSPSAIARAQWHRRHATLMAAAAALVLSAVAAINLTLDPESYYVYSWRLRGMLPAYADALAAAPVGLRGSQTHARTLKVELLNRSNAPVCVIGSSLGYALSPVFGPYPFGSIAPEIVNLSVYNGTIEDFITFAYLAAQRPETTKVIFIAEQWAFLYGRRTLWQQRLDDFAAAIAYFGIEHPVPSKVDLQIKLLLNLINVGYLDQSWKVLTGMRDPAVPLADVAVYITEEPGSFDLVNGEEVWVWLRDGALLTSVPYRELEQRLLDRKIRGLSGEVPQQKAFDDWRLMVRGLKARGIEVIFLMMPLHPDVLEKTRPTALALFWETEARARLLAREEGVTVYGSYDPRPFGCLPDEFLDGIHPKPEGLARIPMEEVIPEQVAELMGSQDGK